MPMSAAYRALYQRSIDDPTGFWGEQAQRIEWQTPYSAVLDDSRLPFAKWFVGGRTNLCHNAVDRHLGTRGEQGALVYVSTETGLEITYTYRQLHREVNRMAASLQALGVRRGDRVLISLPMIPEAAVVFGGFASNSLATRIDDATPRVIVSADAGSRAGKVVEYKPLLDAAIDLAAHKPERVLLVNRQLAPMQRNPRDVDYATLAAQHANAEVPCEWMESSEPSYILYTSGTTGKPKGVQRDTGGYAVALAASMPLIFGTQPGDTMFTASDVGWVVGHSYIVYAPLLAGLTTVMYEGTPIRPDGAVWWRIVEQYRVNVMFTAPTAIRVLKKQDPALLQRHDLSSLRRLFLAGEPLDEPTASWIGEALHKPIVDNYWQTETGWPMLAIPQGVEPSEQKLGSPGFPVYGYKLDILDEATGQPCAPGEKGLLAVSAPLPPGCMTTVWGDDARFLKTYWSAFPGRHIYSSFDWGVRDEEGYVTILGRTDDVINVAGHRLGTREIEESLSSHPAIAEVAVVGVADQLKGQVAMGFAIVRDASRIAEPTGRLALEGELMRTVEMQLGAVARPSRVFFVGALPKTRSGKLLRRAMQAVAEGRDPGDLTTIEDPTALAQVQAAVRGD